MASEGELYSKHIEILKDAPIVPGAVYFVSNGVWEGANCTAGASQPATNWNYYFVNISSHIGKTLYFGFQTTTNVTGVAFLNLYGKIIKAWKGNGNISGIQEEKIEIPKDAHTLVIDYTTTINTSQDFYAYLVVENSKPEELTLIKEQNLINIADAIRYKLPTWKNTYKPSEMASAIDLIDTDVFLSSFIRETEPLYSGTIGTCRWEISRKGVLFLHGGELPLDENGGLWDINNNHWNVQYYHAQNKRTETFNCHCSYWYAYRDYIRMVIVDEPVKAQSTLNSLFAGLNSLWLILGFENIDTSEVTYAGHIFYNCTNLVSIDLSKNDFSKVTYIGFLFCKCSELIEVNFPEMQNLESIESAFDQCSSLAEIDFTSIVDSSHLARARNCFYNCSNLNSIKQNFTNLLNLKVSDGMFYNCSKLKTLDCSQWETSGLLYWTNNMFYNCSSLQNLNLLNFNISGCVNAANLFYNTTSLKEIITGHGWIFSDSLNYSDWLKNCSANIDTTYWDVSGRTSLASFFKDWQGSNILDFTYWNTSNVKTMANMFENCINLTGIDMFSFDMDNVTNMTAMFQNCRSLKWENMTFFDFFETTSRVTNMSNMFNNCISLTEFRLPFSTSSVTNFDGFLKNCYRIKDLNFTNLALNGQNITAKDMLANCGSLRTLIIPGGYNTSYFKPDSGTTKYGIQFPVNMYPADKEGTLEVQDVFIAGASVPSNGNTYYGCGSLLNGAEFNKRIKNFIMDDMTNTKTSTDTVDSQVRKITFSAIDFEMEEDLFDSDFYVAIGAYYNYAGAYAAFNSENGELSIFTPNRFIFFDANSSKMFANFTAVLSIEFNDITTLRCENLSYLFQNCKVLPEISLSTFNTKNVIDMSFMFTGCSLLERIDLTPLSLEKCTKINNILEKCNMLEEITFFNKAPLHGFEGHEMFSGCTNLTSFIQPKTESSFIFNTLTAAFLNCSSLEHLTLPQWATDALTSCSRIFSNCSSLKTVDISTWILSPGLMVNMERMFANCPQLRRVDFPEDMEPLILINARQMFYNCRRLGLDQIGPNGEEGYFKLLPIKFYNEVKQDNKGNWSSDTRSGDYFFAGCECIKTLDLSRLEIEPNHGFIPSLVYFLSASQGKYSGYQLEKIIVGDKIGAYLSKNQDFGLGQKTSVQSPDVRYQSETTGEIFYSIPIYTADIYRIIYNTD